MMQSGHSDKIKKLLQKTAERIHQFLNRLKPTDNIAMLLIALLIGIGAGFLATIFIWMLRQVQLLTALVQDLLGYELGLIIMMVMAGLIVGHFVHNWALEARGRGVPEVMEAVALQRGRIHPRVIISKLLSASITIGAGGSAGREGPIVQIGAALGSNGARFFQFSTEQRRTLVGCGAAAGVAAAFNAPIAGSIFALEVVLGKFTVPYFSAVVISAVAAGITGRVFLGDRPAFDVPAYPFNINEWPVYTILGLLAPLVAVFFVRLLAKSDDIFDRLPLSRALTAALGMLLTAVLGLMVPGQVILGSGLEFIGQAIASDFSMPLIFMFGLAIAKIIATCFTLGSGNSGGVFAPLLFVGALLGGIVGSVGQLIWPEVVVDPGAYAIVGMAAVFAGATRAPITAVLIIFEMSNDYKLILPLLLATVLSTLLAEYLFTESIYTLKLRRKGIHLRHGRDYDIMHGLSVGEVMSPDPFVVQDDMPISRLGKDFQQTHSHGFPVVDKDSNLVGIVSLRDYEQALEHQDLANLQVKDIATMRPVLTAYADEPLSDALERMSVRNISRMPVVSRENPYRLEGIIRRGDIVKAYTVALARRTEGHVDDSELKLRRIDKMKFVDIHIQPHSSTAGQTLAQIAPRLPYESVIVSIRRKGTLLIPHGDTRLLPGDLLHVFVRSADEAALRNCFLC